MRIALALALLLPPFSAAAGPARGGGRTTSGVPSPFVLQDTASATGNGDYLSVEEAATVGFDVTITGAATVVVESSLDLNDWRTLTVVNKATWATAPSITASGAYDVPIGGWLYVRTRISAYTSGTVTIYAWRTSASTAMPTTSAGGGGDGAIQDGADSSIEATVRDYTNSNPVAVALTDASGDTYQAGGGTQYAEDTASGAADQMTMAGAVRKDTAAALVDTDGDRTELQTDASGRLRTNSSDTTQPVSGTVGIDQTGTANDVDAAIAGTVTVSDGAGAMNVIVDSGSVTADTEHTTADLDTGAGTDTQAVTGLRVAKSGGSALVGAGADGDPMPISDDGGSLTVDGTVTVTDGAGALNTIVDSIAAGDNNIGNVDIATMPTVNVDTTAADVVSIDEIATADLDTGAGTDTQAVVGMRVAKSGGSALVGAGADGDPVPISDDGGSITVDGTVTVTDGAGAVNVIIDSGTTAATQATASSLNAEVQGDAATDATVSGNPILAGGRTVDATASAPNVRTSAEDEAVSWSMTKDGAGYVVPFGPQIIEDSDEYTTQQTDASVLAAPGAGLSNYITDIVISCNGAATVTLEDDEATDDLILRHYCDAAGSGMVVHFSTPYKQGANQALLLTTSAAITLSVTVTGWVAP